MVETPVFLDTDRPDVPNLVVPGGVVPFYLPGHSVRGRLVRLGPLADALLTRHDLPDPVAMLLGEAMALVAGMAAALKFQGSLSLQIKGDGPIGLLLTDCTNDGAVRGYVGIDRDQLAAMRDGDASIDAASLLGQGFLAFTINRGPDFDQHQGIVAIEGRNLAQMARHYFTTSEQLRCDIHLACERNAEGSWRAGALILERIATEGGDDHIAPEDRLAQPPEDSWVAATALAATLRPQELLDDDLPAEQLLYRLFHTEGVAADLARALAYGCRCSRARLAGILENFPPDDLDHMMVDQDVVMTCEFCNFRFVFPRTTLHGRSSD